jgi:hypothetical protein
MLEIVFLWKLLTGCTCPTLPNLQVIEAMRDIRAAGVDVITFGKIDSYL